MISSLGSLASLKTLWDPSSTRAPSWSSSPDSSPFFSFFIGCFFAPFGHGLLHLVGLELPVGEGARRSRKSDSLPLGFLRMEDRVKKPNHHPDFGILEVPNCVPILRVSRIPEFSSQKLVYLLRRFHTSSMESVNVSRYYWRPLLRMTRCPLRVLSQVLTTGPIRSRIRLSSQTP